MAQTDLPARTPIKYWINIGICLLVTFGFGYLPPFGSITLLGMKILGIFLGVLYGWIFIEVIWPSLLGLLALMLIGDMKPAQVFQLSFGHPIVQMSFFIFVFCATIEYYGLSRFVSLWFITRKFVAGRPWVFTYMLLGSAFILGGLTSASPATIICWAILYGVCETCGFKKGDSYPAMMVFGIVFSAQMGMSLIPFKQAPLTILGAYENMAGGPSLDYGKYMLIALFICILASLVFLFLARALFKPDMKKLVNLDLQKLSSDNALKLTSMQKIILFFLCLFIFMLLGPTILPADFIVAKFLQAIGTTGVVVLLVTIMIAIRINGKSLLNFKLMSDKGVIWNVVLLLAAVQPITFAMAQPNSGVTQFLTDAMQPIFEFSTPFTFAIIIGFVTVVLIQLMNNAAVGVAMVPVILTYCQATNSSPALALTMVIMSCHLALLTPAASPSAALLLGNDQISPRQIWKASPIAIGVTWLICVLATMSLGLILY